jgi:energy-coupling factor transporter transmembrane protein EcfT
VAKRSLKAKLLPGDGPLARVTPLAAFLVVAAVFVIGVVVRGLTGALLLGLLATGVAVLLAATWRALSPSQRFGRVLVLGVLVAIAISVL